MKAREPRKDSAAKTAYKTARLMQDVDSFGRGGVGGLARRLGRRAIRKRVLPKLGGGRWF